MTLATKTTPAAAGPNQLYNAYDVEEDMARSSHHYERDPEFFYTLTGSKWNAYSCSLWEDGFTATQAEEKKLDTLADMMELRPGQHILDIGFGWGGPLVYLCRQYGVSGHGITVSPSQLEPACQRAAEYDVDTTFELVHWKNLAEDETYDVIYSDEVITHFFDLGDFFAKCYRLLKPDGLMVHKELHLARSAYSVLGSTGQHVNKVYGYTGNYVPLHRELALLDENGFSLRRVLDVPMTHYHRTLDTWLKNMFDNRERLKEITSPDFYKDFRAYLKSVRYIFTRTDHLGCHIVASRKIS